MLLPTAPSSPSSLTPCRTERRYQKNRVILQRDAGKACSTGQVIGEMLVLVCFLFVLWGYHLRDCTLPMPCSSGA
jgi:hypothetical protein